MTSTDLGFEQLRSYQKKGVHFLTTCDSALLADEMGLGKTVQVIMALEVRLKQAETRTALIVAPTALCTNWLFEFSRWAPHLACRRVIGNQQDRLATYLLPVPILIASYEQIRNDMLYLHSQTHFDLVVLDEAQRIKNRSSSTALSCQLLPRSSSWALTGTPVENKPQDLVSIYDFLKRDLLNDRLTRNEIHNRIKPYFLRRRKQEVLPDMPPILTQDIPIELSGQQMATYREAWLGNTDIANELRGGKSVVNALAFINKLKQICNYDPESDESAKLDWLSVFIESVSNGDQKVLIFSQYVETLTRIANRLEAIPKHQYHGQMSSAERDSAVRAFEEKSGPRALLISLRAGGVGLNLPSASDVVMFDRWWNPAVEEQAIHRAHRFGRRNVLHVHRLLVVNSIEERINKLLEEKQQMFASYVEAAPISNAQPLSRADLLSILGMQP